MRIFTTLCFLIFLIGILMGSNIETTEEIDFRLALDYAFASNIDTIFLTTSGGNYFYSTPVTGDTIPLQIYEPIVIMAKPGLAEKPIFRYSGLDSSVIDIFRIQNDVTFEGIIFDGYNAVRPMKWVLRVTHSEDDWTPRRFTKDGLNITIRDCMFRNVYPPDWEYNPGAAALNFYRPPVVATDPPVKAGKVLIENCIFRNIGDEALRISDTEKYVVDRVLDTLIVRNCTFKNISAECIRFYADLDTSTQDAYVLIEHLTVDSSATRMAYIKNNQFTQFRDVIVTNSVLPKPSRLDRYDYIAEVQQRGSLISHVNSWNILINPISTKDKWSAVKNGAEVDTNTVYEFDPLYADPDNFDYSLAPTSPAYGKAFSGNALGDLRWADPSVGIEKPDFLKPTQFTIEQNYPNPFNPSTSIKFTLSKLAEVKLKVYDITGAHIATLVNAPRGVGEHVASWRPDLQASGIYFYHLEVDGKVSETKKMILIK